MVSCTMYYVSASNGTDCPHNTVCNNLSYYLDNELMTSNTVLIFLNGTHILEKEEPAVISGVTNLTLQGVGEMIEGYHWTVRQSIVKITCASLKGGLIFINSSVNFKMLTFYQCGASVGSQRLKPHFAPFLNGLYKISYDFELYADLSASIAFLFSENINFHSVSIQNCSGFCLFSLNTINFNMEQVYIAHTSPTEYYEQGCCSDNAVDLRCIGGNLIMFYLDRNDCNDTTNQNILYNADIIDSILSFGVGYFKYTINRITMSSLTIVDITHSNVTVNMQSVIFFENSGGNFGALTSYMFLYVDNVTSVGANKHICPNSWPGISFKISVTNEIMCPYKLNDRGFTRTDVRVSNSNFSSNLAADSAGMNLDTSLVVTFLQVDARFIVNITDTYVTDNVAAFASCIGIGGLTPIYPSTIFFHLTNTVLVRNHFYSTYLPYDAKELKNPYKGIPPSCLTFGNTAHATFENVTIANHNSLGIYSYNTLLVITGYTVLQNNTGTLGGGLMLVGTSAFLLKSANLSFINNHAERGAGIYISPPLVSSVRYPFCQYQIHGDLNTSDSIINFIGNKASITGDVLYGGNVNDCLLFSQSGVTSSDLDFDSLFSYDKNSEMDFAISSDASRVCFCEDDIAMCDQTHLTTKAIFPGQTVNISVAAIGDLDGYTTGRMIIDRDFYRSEKIDVARCVNVSLSLPSTTNRSGIKSNLTLQLTIDDPFNRQENVPLSLTLPILTCPPGFVLTSYFTCECSSFIVDSILNVSCSIEDGEISHHGDAWVGFDESANCILLSKHCPFDYCSNNDVSFNLSNSDVQCQLNRAGILCGECSEGLSLMLGSNKCGKCSNNGIALLLVFGVAGLALVILLIGLNLTVSVGTINGLIFYANIVKVNEAIFFPDGPIPFLSQFISWLNLDFGFETCFYNGMTPYDKIWLQFLFPIYIWVIMVAIIIACRYSTKLSKLVGSNAVPVLATLLLLSYVKIIRIYILALKVSYVHCGENTINTVWAVDGNVPYWSANHVVLFLFSIFVLLFTVIPYTMFVTLIPVLEKCSQHCGRIWLRFAKPISDAYSGPFKDRYRFWSGLILLARLVIAIAVPFLNQNDRLFLVLFILFFLIFFFARSGGPYKNWPLNILDIWFLSNLQGMAVLALGNLAPVGTRISVSFAFASFFIIVVWHVICQLKKSDILLKCRPKTKELTEVNRNKEPLTSVVSILHNENNKLRESLLDETY